MAATNMAVTALSALSGELASSQLVRLAAGLELMLGTEVGAALGGKAALASEPHKWWWCWRGRRGAGERGQGG